MPEAQGFLISEILSLILFLIFRKFEGEMFLFLFLRISAKSIFLKMFLGFWYAEPHVLINRKSVLSHSVKFILGQIHIKFHIMIYW